MGGVGGGGGGLTIMEFKGHWGVKHFGISEGKGGLKYGSRPSLCMDIIWNCNTAHCKSLRGINIIKS